MANVPGHQPVSVDTADLAPERRTLLERLVHDAGIIDRPPPAPCGYPGAERVITVEFEGKLQTARYPEGVLPEKIQRLVEALHEIASARSEPP
jgi:hypothetical protein